MGLATFLAGANNIDDIKIAASNCSVQAVLIDGNGFTGVSGITLAPANEADTLVDSGCSYNVFSGVYWQLHTFSVA